MDENGDLLVKLEAAMYYHLTMKLLYLSKRARPAIQLPVYFLTTRVRSPGQYDWKKLVKNIQYLAFTKDLPLALEDSSV